MVKYSSCMSVYKGIFVIAHISEILKFYERFKCTLHTHKQLNYLNAFHITKEDVIKVSNRQRKHLLLSWTFFLWWKHYSRVKNSNVPSNRQNLETPWRRENVWNDRTANTVRINFLILQTASPKTLVSICARGYLKTCKKGFLPRLADVAKCK